MLARWLPWLIIAVLLLAIYHEGCNTGESSTRSDTIVTYDTIERTIQTKPRLIHSYRTDTLVQYDTAYIVQDYTTSKVYKDSIVNDTLSIAITDTVSKNAIQGRSVAYKLRLPTRTITNTITRTKHVNGFYLMPYATIVGPKQGVGIGAVYAHRGWTAQVGYGTSGVQIGVGIRAYPLK